MTLEEGVNWDQLEKKIQQIKDRPVKPDEVEIIVHFQITIEIHNLIFEEIRKVIDSFNLFTNYTKDDYDKATRTIHELMEMIGK